MMTVMSACFCASARSLLPGKNTSSIDSAASVDWKVSVSTIPSKGSYSSRHLDDSPWYAASILIAAM